MIEKRIVSLENYSQKEGNCTCGCGMVVEGSFMVRLQAFMYMLEAIYQEPVRHRMTSGSRCKAKNDATPGSAMFSQHLNGLAADGHFDRFSNGKWIEIPVGNVAKHAAGSRLFTGIGYEKYGRKFIHLDARVGAKVVTW